MANAVVISPPQSSSGDLFTAIIVTKGALPVAPARWTLIAQASSSQFAAGLWSHTAAVEPATYTWSLSAPQPFMASIYDFTGVTGIPKFGATILGSNSTSSVPTISSAPAGLLLCVFAALGNTEFSNPAGMSLMAFQQIEGFASAVFSESIPGGATGVKSSLMSISAASVGLAVALVGTSIANPSSTGTTSP